MVAIGTASSLFATLDKDGDGKVSASDLRACMAISEEEAAAILVAVDADGDGLLDCDEFQSLAHEAEIAAGDDEDDVSCLREAFRMYAVAEGEEQEQCITPASLRRMLSRLGSSPQLGMEECRAMICRFDLNGDGLLSFDEFRTMMNNGLM